MLSGHLDRRLILLLDDRLEREEALKAMAHLEACDRCAAAWDALRSDREAIQTSGRGIDLRSIEDLLARDRIAVLATAEPRRHVKVAAGVRPHVLKGLAVSTPAVVALLGILYALGEPQEVPLSTLLPGNTIYGPTVSSMALNPSKDLGDSPPAFPSWAGPEMTPIGRMVLDDRGTEVSQTKVMLGEATVTVTERRGRLPSEIGDVLTRVEDTEREVYLYEEDEFGVVFGSADQVVTVKCDCTVDVLLDIVDGFPEETSPGVFGRLGDGIGVVAEAVTGG